jgi:hypothetical protein
MIRCKGQKNRVWVARDEGGRQALSCARHRLALSSGICKRKDAERDVNARMNYCTSNGPTGPIIALSSINPAPLPSHFLSPIARPPRTYYPSPTQASVTVTKDQPCESSETGQLSAPDLNRSRKSFTRFTRVKAESSRRLSSTISPGQDAIHSESQPQRYASFTCYVSPVMFIRL